MNLSDFRRSGHWPTLCAVTMLFGVSSAVWALLAGLANAIGPEFHLSEWQKSLLVAVPCLGGAIVQPIFGLLTDRFGAWRTGLLCPVLTFVPLLLGWQWADDFSQLLLVGLLLGVAGASFAAALPLTSRWYQTRHQGLAMGIAALGSIGIAGAILAGPLLAAAIGWRGVFAAALIPVAIALVLFAAFAKDSPRRPDPKKLASYRAVVSEGDAWRCGLLYFVTFGGFVGLASYLSVYLHSRFGLSPASAGLCAASTVLVGTLLRPVGGYLCDRFGGVELLTAFYGGVGLLMLDLATAPPLAWTVVLCVAIMAMLGLGSGAVFQLVTQRSSRESGVVTGVVGAAGGLGGFIVPIVLGGMWRLTGSFSGGFLLLAVVAFGSIGALAAVTRKWDGGPAAIEQSSNGEPAATVELIGQR